MTANIWVWQSLILISIIWLVYTAVYMHALFGMALVLVKKICALMCIKLYIRIFKTDNCNCIKIHFFKFIYNATNLYIFYQNKTFFKRFEQTSVLKYEYMECQLMGRVNIFGGYFDHTPTSYSFVDNIP